MSGFTFDNRHSSEFSLRVTRKEIPMTPSIDNRLQDISGVDGAWDYGVSYGARFIEMDCVVVADTSEGLSKCILALTAWLNPRKGVKSLVFDDDPSKQYFARLGNQIPLQTTGRMGTFTLQMICPDPFRYDTSPSDYSFTTFPCVVNHHGTHIARPVMTIMHAGGTATIEQTHPDGTTTRFHFNESAPSGVYIIDCKQFMIVKEGIGAFNHCTGSFFVLPSGSSAFAVTGAVSQIEFSFYYTWI